MRARDIKPGMGLNYHDFGGTYHAIALDRPYRNFCKWKLVPIAISDVHGNSTNVGIGQVFYALARNLSKICNK